MLCFFSKAQVNKGEISGQLVDSVSHAPLFYATVGIYSANDTTLLAYKLSDEKGSFQIGGLPLTHPLRLVVTFTGYAILRRPVLLNIDRPSINMGIIAMKASSLNLDEVMIKGERPPIMVRKDTIEFNAAAFKTLPDALVEDLLRKLPGVNVDKDGNIMVNGRKVSTIYVDGKDFFGGDVRIASKNLPANIIDKVQVSNDQDVLRLNPLMPEADIPQVINLKLKPGIKKGVFGKLYGGGGAKDKFEGGALLNLFRDTTQISLLGYGNNLNKAAFAFKDILSVGGFNRSGWGNANGNGNGGLSIDKVSFGGFGSGLMTSSGGGGNFNTIIDKKVAFNMSYFYGVVNSDYDELKNTRQTYSDTLLTTRQDLKQRAGNYAHMISSKVQFKLSENLALEFKPTIVFTKDNTNDLFHTNSSSSLQGQLNTSDNNQLNDNNGLTYLSWFRLLPTFKKKGRSLSLTNYTSIDDSKANLFNRVNSTFFNPFLETSLNQLRKNDVRNSINYLYVRYTDLLNENLSLSAGLNGGYFSNKNDIATLLSNTNGEYIVPLPSASEDFFRRGLRSEVTVAIRWKHKKLTIAPGIGLGSFNAKNNFSRSAAVNQNFLFFMPTLDLGLGVFNLNYQTNFREPAMVNLQPVANNTNPLFIRYGNPDLKPAFNHSIGLSARKYDTKRAFTYNIGINSTIVKNATIISRTVDASGLQTSLPVNADGTWNLSGNFSFQKDWKIPDNKQISLLFSGNGSMNQTFVLLNQVSSKVRIYNLRPSIEVRVNLNDKLEFNEAYVFSNYKSIYQNTEFANQLLGYHDSRSEIIYRIGKLVFETTMDYRYNSNQVPGLLKSYYKWNAAVTFLFLKGNRGQLKFAGNDLLDQNIVASRTIRENLVEDLQGSTIRRYGLVTFTYNIRNFGEKIGGRNKLF
jgi:hypothetical protein